MKKLNLLPQEIREKNHEKKKAILKSSNFGLIILNLFFVCLIAINLITYKMDGEVNKEIKTVNNSIKINNENDSIKTLGFYEDNFKDINNCETIEIKGQKLNLKYSIDDEEQLFDYVSRIEEIKNCSISYLVSPYNEESKLKFEIGLEIN